MNLKEERTKAWIVFCKVLSVLLFVEVLTGVAWGENSVCLSRHQDSMTHFSNIEKTCNKSHPEKEFIRQHSLSQNFGKEKIHSSASIAGEDFEENVADLVKIIYYICMIVTVIGGMAFLLLCL